VAVVSAVAADAGHLAGRALTSADPSRLLAGINTSLGVIGGIATAGAASLILTFTRTATRHPPYS
jgi:hypothetical protein